MYMDALFGSSLSTANVHSPIFLQKKEKKKKRAHILGMHARKKFVETMHLTTISLHLIIKVKLKRNKY